MNLLLRRDAHSALAGIARLALFLPETNIHAYIPVMHMTSPLGSALAKEVDVNQSGQAMAHPVVGLICSCL